MNTDSSHLILDLWFSGQWDESCVKKIEQIIEQRFTVVQKSRHQFEPHGETVAFILSESHFTLHSYPEENYISVDLYICRRDYDFLPLVREIEEALPLERIHHRNFRRGEYALPWLSRWRGSEKSLAFATFIVAACSLFYELLLAQTLSSILGDTAHRYNITIGLYIASMGLGALLYEKFKFQNLFSSLVKVEILLALIGGVAPLLALIWSDWILEFSPVLTSFGLHGLIVIIGFLSGLELPLLMDMGEKRREGFGTTILAIDYAGTLSAAILFPLLLMPLLPLFSIASLVAGLNLLVALFFIYYANKIKQKLAIIWSIAAAILLLFYSWALMNATELQQKMVEIFYLGGQP